MNNSFSIAKNEDGAYVLCFSESIYNVEAVKNAAFKHTHLFFVKVKHQDNGHLNVIMKAKNELDDDILISHIYEFHNDLLCEQVKIDLSNRFGKLREIIYEHAFSPIDEKE